MLTPIRLTAATLPAVVEQLNQMEDGQRRPAHPDHDHRNFIGVEMVLLPPGDFLCGSSDDDADAQETEKPQRRIQITQPIYLARHEVTQKQWRDVLGTSPWSETPHVQEGDTYPALNVSYDDALEFCRALGEKENQKYRLPTEAEWEYACRAGTTTRYSFGDDADGMAEFAWFAPAGKQPKTLAQSVGAKIGNAFSLHDMHGNVREWCLDWFAEDYYYHAPNQNPPGPESGALRVLRGGAWNQTSNLCRSAAREGKQPDQQLADAGFRIVREYQKKP